LIDVLKIIEFKAREAAPIRRGDTPFCVDPNQKNSQIQKLPMQFIKKTTLYAALLLAFIGFGLSQQAHAQLTVQATGTVLQPLQMTGTDLNFGNNIFPGLDKGVDRTESGAAQFDISGEAGKEVTATLTLPSEMSDGSNSMSITFGPTDGGHAMASTDQASATSFDPNSPLTTTLDATDGSLHLWLGGTVSPSYNQPAGTYQGDITLDIAYTGN